MGRGILGDLFGDLFGSPEPEEFGSMGGIYNDLFANDPIQGLPKTPYLYPIQDPAQDAFQFPFQDVGEDPSGGAYGPQHAPVDVPENVLQESDSAQQNPDNPDNDNAFNWADHFNPGASLVENAFEIGKASAEQQGFDLGAFGELNLNQSLLQNVWNIGKWMDENPNASFWGDFGKHQAGMDEQSEIPEQPGDVSQAQPMAQSFEDVLSPDDFSDIGQKQTSEPSGGLLGDQTPDVAEIGRVLEANPSPFETWNDLRGVDDFDDIGQPPTADKMSGQAQEIQPSEVEQEKVQVPQFEGTLKEQYPEPGELAAFMETIPDASFEQWNDLRTQDESGMAYAPPEEPGANGELGNAALDETSPVVHANETLETVGVDIASQGIASGQVVEAVGLDVLPAMSDLLDLAAALIL